MLFRMNNFMANRWTLASASALAMLMVGCAPTQVEPSASTGSLNVQRYIAVGDSYSTGFSDGGLTRTGQENSFPALLAKVFQRVTNSPFTQPLLEAGTGTGYVRFVGLDSLGLPRTQRVDPTAVRSTITNLAGCGDTDTILVLNRWATPTDLPQNLAVPGLQVSQVQTPGYGDEASATPATVNAYNPYFERLLPASDQRTYLNVVAKASRNATFFTYFAGLDDLLPYLRSGAACGTFPSQTTFANNLKAKAKLLLDSLTAGGRPGIVAQVPALNTLPLLRLGAAIPLQAKFRALRHNPSLLIYVINSRLFNQGGTRGVVTKAEDDANNYILATALSRLGKPSSVMVNGTAMMLPYGLDIRNPVRNEDVIDYSEYSVLNGIVTSHNTDLLALTKDTYKMPSLSTGTTYNPLLDIGSTVFLQSDPNRIAIAGVQYSNELVRGGVFSLDYYSLTPRGYGLMANAFISAINLGYNATLPAVDVNNLPTTAK